MNQLINCPVCNDTSFEVFSVIENSKYLKCQKCTAVFLDKIKPQSDYLQQNTYLSNPDEYLKIVNFLDLRWLVSELEERFRNNGKTSGKLLEIGAGVGLTMAWLVARNWMVDGIEVSEPAANFGMKIFKFNINTCPLLEFNTNTKYDGIYAIETLEHFTDPFLNILKIKDLLEDGSIFIGTTPNIESTHWKNERNILEPDDHICLFSPNSIAMLSKRANFKKCEISFFGGEQNDAHLFFVLQK